jgi:peptidylprolyl isomerase
MVRNNWNWIVKFGLVLVLTVTGLLGTNALPSYGALPKQSAIKDARILLRNALPIDNPTIREIQHTLETMPKLANLKRWGTLKKDIDKILTSLETNQDKIINSIPETHRAFALKDLQSLKNTLLPLKEAIASKDRNSIKPLSEKALDYVGSIEEAMIAEFPFAIPPEYAHLPQLRGRAVVAVSTDKGDFQITLDGYSAPLNAGVFADLVQKGFYDGLTFNRADESYYLQSGDPQGPADGYIDPATGQLRRVPMEIRVPNRPVPIYGHTLEEVGMTYTLPVLPFSAYGTVAMAHPANDNNGGSSQFFLYLFESDLTPAGLNLMDGNYSVFGYVTAGQEVLYKLRLGDRLNKLTLVKGAENLVQGINS